MKRVTVEDDIRRLSENIHTRFGRNIRDRHTANRAFDLFMSDVPLTQSQEISLKKEVTARLLFRSARGKDILRDRQVTAKRVTSRPDEFIKLGARNVDLSGVDTFKGKKIKRAKRILFTSLGRQKGKIVYARKVEIKKGKKIIVKFRDSRGRFVKVNR